MPNGHDVIGTTDDTVSARIVPAIAAASVAGLCAAVQPKINAVLGAQLGSALIASLVNFSGAFVVVVIALTLRPGTRRRLAGLRSWDVPRWTMTAGLGGVVVVLAGALTVQTIGVAVFSVGFFAGQITFGLLVDRIGLGPGDKRLVTAARLQAMIVALVAVVLSQLGRSAGEFAPAFVAFAVASGGGIAFQSAFNGRIASSTGDPFAATAVNVTVGLTALGILVASLALGGVLDPPHWPSEPWLYIGGTLGVTVVVSLATATASLGVLRTTLAMLAAQIIAAFSVDWVVQGEPPTVGVLIGAVLIVGAVARVGRRPAPIATPQTGEN